VLNLGVDRRMLVNRQRRLKMYRCWLQAKFRKPFETDGEAEKEQAIPGESAVGMMANEAASEAALVVEEVAKGAPEAL
jgi:tRNAThr (cytosine32-N3)-methyltransferase